LAEAPRIGLFGGSFDPPHLAHRALADLALHELGLSELRWIPAGQPWQKAGRGLASTAHREAMLRLAMGDEPAFTLDLRELRRTGPSYTADTVRELQLEHPGAQWVLVIGQDQYARLHTWHQWRWLLDQVSLAVAAREGQTPVPSPEVAAVPHRVQHLPLPEMPVSSTAVRQAAAREEELEPMVGKAVAGYIALHHLYRGQTPN